MKQLLLIGLLSSSSMLSSCTKYKPKPNIKTKQIDSICNTQIDTSLITEVQITNDPTQLYVSPYYGEMSGCLTTHWPFINNMYEFFPIYSFHVTGIEVGDIVEIDAEFEATNTFNHPIMIGSFISMDKDSVTTLVGPGTPNAYNVTPDMHHAVINKHAAFIAESNFDGYITLVGYAGTSWYSEAYLVVHKNLGRMYIKITKHIK